jgi:hypothetical protein
VRNSAFSRWYRTCGARLESTGGEKDEPRNASFRKGASASLDHGDGVGHLPRPARRRRPSQTDRRSVGGQDEASTEPNRCGGRSSRASGGASLGLHRAHEAFAAHSRPKAAVVRTPVCPHHSMATVSSDSKRFGVEQGCGAPHRAGDLRPSRQTFNPARASIVDRHSGELVQAAIVVQDVHVDARESPARHCPALVDMSPELMDGDHSATNIGR